MKQHTLPISNSTSLKEKRSSRAMLNTPSSFLLGLDRIICQLKLLLLIVQTPHSALTSKFLVLPGRIRDENRPKLDPLLQQMASSILSLGLNQGSQAVVQGIRAAGLASSQTAWIRTNCFSHLCPWKCPCLVCKRQAGEILPQLGNHPNWADGIMSLSLNTDPHPPPTSDSALFSFKHRLQSCVLQQIHLTQTHSLSLMLMLCPAPQGHNTRSCQYFFS